MKILFKILFYIFGTIGILATAFIAVAVYQHEFLSNPLAGRIYACNLLIFPAIFEFYKDGTIAMDKVNGSEGETLTYSFIHDGHAVAIHFPPDEQYPNGSDYIFPMPPTEKWTGRAGFFSITCRHVTRKQAESIFRAGQQKFLP